MDGRRLSLALAGGGTGGHVTPGLHLLSQLVARGEDGEEPRVALERVLWIGAGRPVEERLLEGADELVAPAPLERVRLDLEPAGGGAPSRAKLLARLPRAVRDARRALARARPDVCVGLGGYTSVPAVLAARTLRVPTLVLEVNAVPGLATRLLAPVATRVLRAFPPPDAGARPLDAAAPGDPPARELVIGPPLGRDLERGEPEGEEARAARAALGLDPARPVLLVLGGSQGAGALNAFVRTHSEHLVDAGLQVLHQVGPGRLPESAPPRTGYRAVELLTPIRPALAAATLVLARAGAGTASEIAAARRPSFLVPYPHSPDRHQHANARALGDGARLVPEPELDESICTELRELASDAGAPRRRAMADELARRVPLDGGRRFARAVLAAARPR